MKPIILLGVAATLFAAAAPAAGQSISPEDIATAIVDAPRTESARLSPNGRWLASSNGARVRVMPLSADGRMSAAMEFDAPGVMRWAPDNRLAIFNLRSGADNPLVLIDPSSRRSVPVAIRGTEYEAGPVEGRAQIRAVAANGSWSRSGRYYAALLSMSASPPAPREPWRNRSAANPYAAPPAGWRIVVLDVSTGIARVTSPPGRSVRSFDWSPDETAMAIEVESLTDRDVFSQARTDLAILDLANGDVRPLTSLQGNDEGDPAWSPDGRWVAFALYTDTEQAARSGSAPSARAIAMALVSPATGEVRRFPREHSASSGDSRIRWAPDGGGFFYETVEDLQRRIRRADVERGVTELLPLPSIGRPYWITGYGPFTADGRAMTFQAETLVAPTSTYYVHLDTRGRPRGRVREITPSAEQPVAPGISARQISWPSRDGLFRIEGVLLLPTNQAGRALPLIVSAHGGPGMIDRSFHGDNGGFGLEPALAMRGFAVLIPNTRGRRGGSEALAYGILDQRSRYRLPLEDVLAGIDMLVAQGVADRAKVGLFGHSYGGGLGAYALGHSDRFGAVVIHEGGYLNMLDSEYVPVERGSQTAIHMRDLFMPNGAVDEEEVRARMAESPVFAAARSTTPALLLYGGNEDLGGTAVSEGWSLYRLLRRSRAPVAFLISNSSGHGFSLRYRREENIELIATTVEWFDYWLRGLPYPNPERARLLEQAERRMQ